MRQRGQRRAPVGACEEANAASISLPHLALISLACLLALLLLTACNAASTPSGGAHATQTAQAQATKGAQATATDIAQMVTMTAQAQAQGSIASLHLRITIMFTLINHTNIPIHMYRVCGDIDPPVHAYFLSQDGKIRFAIGSGGPCQLGVPPSDYPPALTPGAAQTWVHTEDDSVFIDPTRVGGSELQPGTYQVQVKVRWHQGILDDADGSPGHALGVATAQTTITIQ